jgi:hypothetical protein
LRFKVVMLGSSYVRYGCDHQGARLVGFHGIFPESVSPMRENVAESARLGARR